jgi:hypothetical protein
MNLRCVFCFGGSIGAREFADSPRDVIMVKLYVHKKFGLRFCDSILMNNLRGRSDPSFSFLREGQDGNFSSENSDNRNVMVYKVLASQQRILVASVDVVLE